MKLRVRGNSIRLRLLKTEVAALGESGRVAESVSFGPSSDQRVTYAVQVAGDADSVSAVFNNNEICVELPVDIAEGWINSEKVGISAEMKIGEDSLEILVEKDFVCLTRTDDPDNQDAYPNPETEC